jgi:outer membrane protein assembly factor BamB
MKAITCRTLFAAIALSAGFLHGAIAAVPGTEIKLIASDNAAEDRFGYSVAISGTKAIVGAPRDDDRGDESGSAYLFDALTGNQLFKLNASDGADEDRFGFAVGISGNTVVVGALYDDDKGSHSGSAYLFDATTGAQLRKLVAADGTADDIFGSSVAINGNFAVVGA